jgi:hypothetical protein
MPPLRGNPKLKEEPTMDEFAGSEDEDDITAGRCNATKAAGGV